MSTVHYPAIIERGETCYGIFFPDLPGCGSVGDSVTDAILNAEEALSSHLALLQEYGDPIPAPSSIEELERDPEVNEIVRALVRGERPGKSVRVQITLEEGLLARIDRTAPNRSGFLAKAARMALAAEANN